MSEFKVQRKTGSDGKERIYTMFPDGSTQIALVIPNASIAQNIDFSTGVLTADSEAKSRFKMVSVNVENAKGETVTKRAQIWEGQYNSLADSFEKGSEVELHAMQVPNKEGKVETFYKIALPTIPRDTIEDTLNEFGFDSFEDSEENVEALFATEEEAA